MRIAIFYAPPADHPLSAAAARWLGRDASSGKAVAQPQVDGLAPSTLRDLTAEPRRYGFHATLKPPFRLAPGATEAGVVAALLDFCRGRRAFGLPPLRLARLGPFFALTPSGPSAALDSFAGDIVRVFDPFRAPPTEEERARRRPERLTPRQRRHLADWGYPYVFDEFRFHMTLTGPVPDAEAGAVERALRHHFAGFLGETLAIDALSLFVEREPPADFVIESRVPMAGADAPMDAA